MVSKKKKSKKGRLKMAIFDLLTSVKGLNRSDNQESSLGDQIGLRSL